MNLMKQIGDAQGISVPDSKQMGNYEGGGSGYGYSMNKSQTWSLWINTIQALGRAEQPDNVEAFINTYAVLPWIYVGTWVISSSIASRPLLIYKGRGEKAELVEDGPAYELLNHPNEFEDGAQFVEGTAVFLELTGNAFWEKALPYLDLAVKLFNIEPQHMNIVPCPRTKIKGYFYEYRGERIDYEVDEIAHFRYTNPTSPFWGQGTVKPLQTTLITELYREIYNKAYFENEARPDVVLTQNPDPTKGAMPLIEAAREELAEKWSDKFGAPRNSRRPVVLPPGFDVKLLTEAIQDMSFREMEKSLRERVLGAMGVPPALVGLFEFANYANSREQLKIFWSTTLPPKMDRIAKTITRCILRPFDSDMWCKFDDTDIPALREDDKDQVERLAMEYDRGIIDLGEWRKQRNYGATGDPEIDRTRVIMQSLIPIGEAGALPEEGGSEEAEFEEIEEPEVEEGEEDVEI